MSTDNYGISVFQRTFSTRNGLLEKTNSLWDYISAYAEVNREGEWKHTTLADVDVEFCNSEEVYEFDAEIPRILTPYDLELSQAVQNLFSHDCRTYGSIPSTGSSSFNPSKFASRSRLPYRRYFSKLFELFTI
ncbi:hypothetical protein RUND412_008698 [Rhizina undulata]